MTGGALVGTGLRTVRTAANKKNRAAIGVLQLEQDGDLFMAGVVIGL